MAKTPVEQVTERFLTEGSQPTDGTVELWMTKEGNVVIVLPMWDHGRDETDPMTVMKMLWFDRIDHDWVVSDLYERLVHKVGELNLYNILEQHGAAHGKCEKHD